MPLEKDWKLFRRKVPLWQEAYMEKLIQEYVAVLNNTAAPASERFWVLADRVKADQRGPGVILDMRRSTMEQNLIALLEEQVITLDDLSDFSDELQQRFQFLFKNNPEMKGTSDSIACD